MNRVAAMLGLQWFPVGPTLIEGTAVNAKLHINNDLIVCASTAARV